MKQNMNLIFSNPNLAFQQGYKTDLREREMYRKNSTEITSIKQSNLRSKSATTASSSMGLKVHVE